MNLHLAEIEEYRKNQDPRVVQALERMVSTIQSPSYEVSQSCDEDDEKEEEYDYYEDDDGEDGEAGEDEDGDEPELLSNPDKSQHRYRRRTFSLTGHYPNRAESANEEFIRGRTRNRSPPGLVGANRPGFAERQRTRSRSQRSRSRVNRKAPVVAAGLGIAAIAGLYERRKERNRSSEIPIQDGEEQKPAFETAEELILNWTTLTVDEM